jgi:predicted dehydrogenase
VIRLAILGGGFMASAHAGNYAAMGDRVRVKTVASKGEARAAKVAEKLGAAAGTDLQAVLADPEIDAVDICLPTPLHRELADAAFAAGKHVFLEKPIALSVEDADAIIRAAEASGRILMVGMVLRFWPEYVELQRRVSAGELGKPVAATTYRLSPPADWNDWMADPAQSGGTAVDLMIHDLDQLNWLLGTPRRVYAQEPAPGHVVAVVEYDGAAAHVEASMAMPKSYPFSSNIRVLCEGGVAEYGFSAAPAEDGGNIGAVTAARGLRLFPTDGEPVTVPVESTDPWGPELDAFVRCVEAGDQPAEGTGEQAREALRVALAVNRSIASGRPEEP